MNSLYYESHVTIEPVFGERRQLAADTGHVFGFRMAKLLMRKREADADTPHVDDAFFTGRALMYEHLRANTQSLVRELQTKGFVVRRYKIEDTVLDSNIKDELGLL